MNEVTSSRAFWAAPVACLLTFFGLFVAPVMAEDIGGDLDFFRASPFGSDWLTMYTGNARDMGFFSVGVIADHETPVMAIERSGTPCKYKYVSQRVTSELLLSLSVWNGLELGLAMPVVLYNVGDEPALGGGMASMGAGNFRGHVKYIFNRANDKDLDPLFPKVQPPHLFGIELTVAAPTGNSNSLFGTTAPVFTSLLIYHARMGRLHTIVNVGASARIEPEHIGPFEIGQELIYGLGTVFPLNRGEDFHLILEARGATEMLAPFKDVDRSPLEFDVASSYTIGQFRFMLGAGTGPMGYPSVFERVFVGVTWLPSYRLFGGLPDKDRDGIQDKLDDCPTNHLIL